MCSQRHYTREQNDIRIMSCLNCVNHGRHCAAFLDPTTEAGAELVRRAAKHGEQTQHLDARDWSFRGRRQAASERGL